MRFCAYFCSPRAIANGLPRSLLLAATQTVASRRAMPLKEGRRARKMPQKSLQTSIQFRDVSGAA